MIKYSYTLERDESDEKKVYRPALPTEIPDLAYIQGPNSSGKSTFLNIIALAFFGHRLGPEELNMALHERLINLSQADHQKLQFEIELSTKNGDIKLGAIKKKNSIEPEVRRTGSDGKSKPISFEQFKREFRLIYDIPQDPLSRLPLLLREIKIAQIDKGNQISRLKKRLFDIITEVKESKNPERLAELQLNIDLSKKRLARIATLKGESEKSYLNKRNFCLLKVYLDAQNEQLDASAKIKRLELQICRYKKAENKQSQGLVAELRKMTEAINAAEELHKKIAALLRILLPKNELKKLELWNELKCADEIKAKVDIQTIRNDALHFINYLNGLLEKESAQKEEAEFLQSLLSVLEGYKGQDFTIPGTNINIKQFISSLKETSASFRKLLIKSEQIAECQGYLHDIRQHISDGVRHHTEFVRIAKKHGATVEQLVGDLENEELNETKLKLEQLNKKVQDCRSRLVEHAIDYDKAQENYEGLIENEDCHGYVAYSEPQLDALVEEALQKVENLNRDEENCKREIQLNQSELSRLEKLGTHKYQGYLMQLEHLFITIQNLEKTIAVTFNKIISDMIESKVKDVSRQEELYFEQIQRFLATKIGTIRHINSSYALKSVDVITKEITTTSGKKIKFADLGTGQSQGAYIEALLNSNSNKKIIALFDEVAMMDSHTLKPIFKKIKKMYDSNKLIAAVIVQKGDEDILVKSLADL